MAGGPHAAGAEALRSQTEREGPEFRPGRAVLPSPLRSWKFCDVIPEIDIWRAATLMLKRYGEKALEESASRVEQLASAGDDDGGHLAPEARITHPIRPETP